MDSSFRPRTLEEFVGQRHLVGKDGVLYKLLLKDALPHSFFYAPPVTVKTDRNVKKREINSFRVVP